jgi:hypothetical protein
MAIHAYWADAGHSIYVMAYRGAWTVEEYQKRFSECMSEIEYVGYPVDLVVDMSHAAPPPLRVLSTTSQTVRDYATNLRSVTVVAVETVTRNVVQFARSAVGPAGAGDAAPAGAAPPVTLADTLSSALETLGIPASSALGPHTPHS